MPPVEKDVDETMIETGGEGEGEGDGDGDVKAVGTPVRTLDFVRGSDGMGKDEVKGKKGEMEKEKAVPQGRLK